MPTSAKAAVLEGPRRFELTDIVPPQPDRGDVLLRLQGCGVCASNIPPWDGRAWFQYPLPPGNPGHEAWGVVEAVGNDVATLRVGDRVAVLTEHAYATHDVASADRSGILPPELDGRPFPGDPLACAFNVSKRCAVLPGERVAIIGSGFMGAVLTALCREAGAEVIAISRRSSSLATNAHERDPAVGTALEVASRRPEGFVKALLQYD